MKRAGRAALLCALLTTTVAGQQDLAALVAQLGSDDAEARSVAYRALQQRRDPELPELLGPRLASLPRHGRQLAVHLLRQLVSQVPNRAYHDLMRREQPFVRAIGAGILASRTHLGPGESPTAHLDAVRTLVEAMADMPEDDRLDVVGVTIGIDDPRIADRLRAWLRAEASTALADSVLRELLRRENGSSAPTRVAAAALAGSSSPDVRALGLAYLARDADEHGVALAALLNERPASFWLVRDLLDTDRKLATALVGAMTAALAAPRASHDIARTAELLRKQSPGAAVAELRQLLRHDNTGFRAAALQALVALPGGLSDQDLRALLVGDDVESGLIAAEALRRRDDPSGLDAVLRLLPRAGQHKAAAARVLGGFRDRRVATPLLDLLDDDDVAVRTQAWTGLQALMRGLFPYRRFDFGDSGYQPQAPSRAAGIAALRAWWAAVDG